MSQGETKAAFEMGNHSALLRKARAPHFIRGTGGKHSGFIPQTSHGKKSRAETPRKLSSKRHI